MTRSTLPGALGDLDAKRMGDVHTSIPGRVETYDRTTQRASVQPLLQRSYRGEEGERIVETLPVIHDVPVVFPGSGDDYSDTWPISRGDIVWLQFAEASIDKWLHVGGGIVDPRDDRRFNMNDAVAFPGLRDFRHPVPAAGIHATARVIRAPLIHAGGDQKLALHSDLVALRNWVAGLLTGGSGSAIVPGTPTPVGTTVLKGG
jgi:hypothetical protein